MRFTDRPDTIATLRLSLVFVAPSKQKPIVLNVPIGQHRSLDGAMEDARRWMHLLLLRELAGVDDATSWVTK